MKTKSLLATLSLGLFLGVSAHAAQNTNAVGVTVDRTTRKPVTPANLFSVNVLPGDNVTIVTNEDGTITISSTGGGGTISTTNLWLYHSNGEPAVTIDTNGVVSIFDNAGQLGLSVEGESVALFGTDGSASVNASDSVLAALGVVTLNWADRILYGDWTVGGVTASGTITAPAFVGDGSGLTGISGGSGSQTPILQDVDFGNHELTNAASITTSNLNVQSMTVGAVSYGTNAFAGAVVDMDAGMLQTTNMTGNITLTGISNGGLGKSAGLVLVGGAVNYTFTIDQPFKPTVDTNRVYTVYSNTTALVWLLQPTPDRTNVVFLPDSQ